MNKKIMLAVVLLLFSLFIWAGDTAVFVDLGFSADGKTYMFGQYGVQPDTFKPWADLFVIDVASNNYVSGGKVNYVHTSPVTAGHDGSGALYRIVARNAALADRHNISFLSQGRLLYVAINENLPVADEMINFRCFDSPVSYTAALRSSFRDSGGSSFSINLERRGSDGSVHCYTIGNSAIKRPGIVSYRISRVITSPRNDSLVFVIETRKLNPSGGTDIRYMVETVRL